MSQVRGRCSPGRCRSSVITPSSRPRPAQHAGEVMWPALDLGGTAAAGSCGGNLLWAAAPGPSDAGSLAPGQACNWHECACQQLCSCQGPSDAAGACLEHECGCRGGGPSAAAWQATAPPELQAQPQPQPQPQPPQPKLYISSFNLAESPYGLNQAVPFGSLAGPTPQARPQEPSEFEQRLELILALQTQLAASLLQQANATAAAAAAQLQRQAAAAALSPAAAAAAPPLALWSPHGAQEALWTMASPASSDTSTRTSTSGSWWGGAGRGGLGRGGAMGQQAGWSPLAPGPSIVAAGRTPFSLCPQRWKGRRG
jgi:hypothetical protein